MRGGKRPLSGVVCLGDSTTHMSYMVQSGASGLEPGGSGASNQLSKRWTEKLAVTLGAPVWNYGQNGRKTSDLYSGSGAFHFLLQGAGQRGWKNARARVIVIWLGINDDDVSVDEYAARYRILLGHAVGTGAAVVCGTLAKVDYPAHYSTDRNAIFVPQNTEIAAAAAEYGCTLADIYSRYAAEITGGNWDLFIRPNGTIDNSTDAGHEADPSWFTDVHPGGGATGEGGPTVIADEFAGVITGLGVL